MDSDATPTRQRFFPAGIGVLLLSILFAGCLKPAPADLPPRVGASTAATRTATEQPAIAKPTPKPTQAACQPGGQVILGNSPASRGVASLKFRLYLPPCYDEARPGGYPLLVMLHGILYGDDQWDRLGADDIAERLILDGEAPPFIILMPAEPASGTNLLDSDFDTWLMDGLLPYVDEHYNTCRQRACRAIGGLSRGAVWALRLGFLEWQSFGAVGGHSLLGGYPALPVWSHQFNGQAPPRLYFDSGTADPGIGDLRRVMTTLDILQIPYEWHLNPGGHDETYWAAHVAEYLRWYSRAW